MQGLFASSFQMLETINLKLEKNVAFNWSNLVADKFWHIYIDNDI